MIYSVNYFRFPEKLQLILDYRILLEVSLVLEINFSIGSFKD